MGLFASALLMMMIPQPSSLELISCDFLSLQHAALVVRASPIGAAHLDCCESSVFSHLHRPNTHPTVVAIMLITPSQASGPLQH